MEEGIGEAGRHEEGGGIRGVTQAWTRSHPQVEPALMPGSGIAFMNGGLKWGSEALSNALMGWVAYAPGARSP